MLGSLSSITIIGYGLLALLSAYWFTWLARWLAPGVGMVDKPDGGRKSHAQTTPLLGGVAILLAFALTLLVATCLAAGWFWTNPSSRTLGLNLALGSCLFCLIGLLDDRYVLRPRNKFLLQIAASIPCAVFGRSIDSIQCLGLDATLGVLAVPFTVVWLVACVNIVNLVDGLDGLASSIGVICSLTIAILSLIAGKPDVAMLSLIVAGCLVGFLAHNWPPAKIFLGDSGSLTIGFLIGALSIEASIKTAAGFTLAVPLVVLSVPIFDTMMAILRRKLNGRRIGDADRAHIHHQLQDRGLSTLQTLLSISGLCIAMACAAIAAAFWRMDWIAVIMCLTVLAVVIAGRVFGYHETLLVFRHVQAIQTLLADVTGILGTRFFLARFQDADSKDQAEYWQEALQRVGNMGGVYLELTCYRQHLHDVVSRHRWETNEPLGTNSAVWEFRCSVPRDDQICVSLSAIGRSTEGLKRERGDDLFRLFDTLCRHWPLDHESQVTTSEEHVAPQRDLLDHAWSITTLDASQREFPSDNESLRRAA